MTLNYFLSSLYNNEKSFVDKLVHGPTNMISKSVYAKEYKHDRSKAILIHSGFSFELSYDKTMELYYDITNNTIVRQVKINDNPQVLGLTYRFADTFVGDYENRFLLSLDMNTNDIVFCNFDNLSNPEADLALTILIQDKEHKYKVANHHFQERVYSLSGFDHELVGKNFATKRELNQAFAEHKRHQGHIEDGQREMDSWEEDFGEWR